MFNFDVLLSIVTIFVRADVYSGLTISGFDFEFSGTDLGSKHFSFLERVGLMLDSNFSVVNSSLLQSFPSFLESAVCLFSKQHAVEAARLAAADFIYRLHFDPLIMMLLGLVVVQ